MRTILVAGATGQLGRLVLPALHGRGYAVRALSRDPARVAALGHAFATPVRGDLDRAASLRAACGGVDAVVSCAGASMALGGFGDRRSFMRVDYAGNLALLNAARAAGVRKFVYVSLFGAEQVAGTEYVDAHERFARELAASGMDHAVVRPTGFFSFLTEIVKMAARGRGPVLGDGTARMNPVHEADVAAACVDALGGREGEVPVGGPDVLTRREMVEMAFRAVGRPPRLMHLPPGLFRGMARVMKPVQPRLAALVDFGAVVTQVDVVAPVRGTRRLEDHFRDVATAL